MNNVELQKSMYEYDTKSVCYEIDHISPALEMERRRLMLRLKKECQNILDIECIKINISNILPRWIMLQFSEGDSFIDPLFPYNGIMNTQLERDLIILSKGVLNKNNINIFMHKLTLSERCSCIVDELKEFILSPKYLSSRNNCNVYVTKKNEMSLFTFNNMTLTLGTDIVQKIIDNYETYTKCHSKISIPVNTYIMCILMRYHTLDSCNQQLSVNPYFYEYLNKHYGVNFELFGSAINTKYRHYCSLFSDLEKNNLSVGKFDNLIIKRGFYVANPPFDEHIMMHMTLKIIDILSQSDKNIDREDDLTFIVVIPAWDNPAYGYNESLTLMNSSRYLEGYVRVDKASSKFFNYTTKRYINPCDVCFLLLQNKRGRDKYNISLESIISKIFH